MNGKLPVALSCAAALLLSAFMAARAGVVSSAHDLRVGADTDVCGYCHTHHNASTDPALAGVVAWNRQTPTGPYQMYNQSVSSTLEGEVAASPEGVSLACLSCHDGTLAFNAVLNGALQNAGRIAAGPALIGTDLRGGHPISIRYGADPTLQPFSPGANGVGMLPLYSGSAYTNDDQVECGSCHDPHNTTNDNFLRVANTGSALCNTCHTQGAG